MRLNSLAIMALVAFLSWLAPTQESHAQNQVLVPAFGFAAGPTPLFVDLVAKWEYDLDAAAIAASPPVGFTYLSTDTPTVTIFPLPDGTFHATATGNVVFQRIPYQPNILLEAWQDYLWSIGIDW